MHLLETTVGDGAVVGDTFRFRVNTLFGGLNGALFAIAYILRAIYAPKK